jgi:hypothetical protein
MCEFKTLIGQILQFCGELCDAVQIFSEPEREDVSDQYVP